MSIDISQTETLYEKLDVIANLIEQMYLMCKTNNIKAFEAACNKASKLCFEAIIQVEEANNI